MQETKKAFRAIDKRKDLEGAVNALSNLKGVGPAMASGNHQRPSSKCSKKGGLTITILLTFSITFAIELVLQQPPPVALLTINDCGDSSSGRCSFFSVFQPRLTLFVITVFYLLQRGKFYPQLTNLVRINTPRAVQTESRKAFRKLPNVEAAITTLCGLKGVGTTLASGVPSLHLSA